MKKASVGIAALLAAFFFCFSGVSAAEEDFFDVISFAVKGSGQDKAIDAAIYGTLSTTAWNDLNADGDLDSGEALTEPVRIYGRDGGLALESPDAMTREQLEDWALENYEEILAIIFPSGLSQNTGQSEDSLMAVHSLSDKMAKVRPAAKKKSDGQGLSVNDEFKGVLEYLSIEADGADGDAGSILIGYSRRFDGGAEFRLLLPYRYTALDDEIDSKSHYLGLDLSAKFPLKSWDTMVWHAGADVFGSAFYLKSDSIEHAGNFKYGAGLFTSFTKRFDFATLCVGVDYKISDVNVPSGWVDSDNEFVDRAIDYLNDLEAVGALSYGFNLGVPFFGDAAAANLEVIRSNFFSDDIEDDRDSQTTVGLSFSYFPSENFELSAGARRTFELEEIDLTGVYLGAVFRY